MSYTVYQLYTYRNNHLLFLGCDVADLLEGLNATKANTSCYVFPEGAVCYTGISEGSIANYSSNTDYLLSDPNNAHRMCMNGSWTGLVPMFLPSKCSS